MTSDHDCPGDDRRSDVRLVLKELLAAVEAWAQEDRVSATGATDPAGCADGAGCAASAEMPDCTRCPICFARRWLAAHPEQLARLSKSARSLVEVVREVLERALAEDTNEDIPDAGPNATPDTAAADTYPTRGRTVSHIPVERAPKADR